MCRVQRSRIKQAELKDPIFIYPQATVKTCLACLIGDRPLGIDLQHGRKMDPAKISARYFAEEEAELVRKLGAAAFFRLWTRKEAYSKYTGNGLADVMRGISVLDRNDVEFLDFQWEKDIYCSCCVKKE